MHFFDSIFLSSASHSHAQSFTAVFSLSNSEATIYLILAIRSSKVYSIHVRYFGRFADLFGLFTTFTRFILSTCHLLPLLSRYLTGLESVVNYPYRQVS